MFKKLILVSLLLMGCRETIPAGNVGVIVSLTGDDKGVHERVAGVGKQFIGWNEELYLFPTFTQTYNWTRNPTEGSPTDESITFQTTEGLTVNADFGITLSIDSAKAAVLFQKYRRTITEVIDSVLRNNVRDALMTTASKMKIEDVMSAGKVALMEQVNILVKNSVIQNGIIVEKVFIIGEFRPPQSIIDAINSKIQATQNAIMVENQLRQTEAEAKKTVMAARAQGEALLAKAEAEAKANRLLAESLSSNLINKMYLEKWDGKLPTYSGANPVPFLNIK